MRWMPGDQWLRLTAVTAANLGASNESAAVDRPTQKEPFWGLPYLPDSALKGVLAACSRREGLYGTGDDYEARDIAWGKPGSAVFGNGELLCFPAPLTTGGFVWVFPALALARCWSSGFGEEGSREGVLTLLELLEAENDRFVGDLDLAALDAGWRFRAYTGALEPRVLQAVGAGSRSLAGDGEGPAPWMVTSSASAGALWREVAEIRWQTALTAGSKTALPGSLRSIELIPPASVFLSRVSLLSSEDAIGLPERIQLGAGNNVGLGIFGLDRLGLDSSWEGEIAVENAGLKRQHSTHSTRQKPLQVMTAMHGAIKALLGASSRQQKEARSAIYELGPRLSRFGAEAALSFALARARPVDPVPGETSLANRWLLAAVLNLPGRPLASEGPYLELEQFFFSESSPFSNLALAGFGLHDFVTRATWLRRFAELALEAEVALETADEPESRAGEDSAREDLSNIDLPGEDSSNEGTDKEDSCPETS